MGRRGKIVLDGDGLLPEGTSSGTIHDRVVGGTGAYTGATGSGDVAVAPLRGGRTTLDVDFS